MKRFYAVLGFSTLFFVGFATNASAQPIDNCRISASKWNIVSLGFPLRGERLASLSTANILVIPYQLKDAPKYSITEGDKSVFENAVKNITDFSGGKLKLNLIYNPTVELSLTSVDLDEIKRGVQINWQKNFEKSTYGFTARVLKENDKSINFKGINAVVLYGSSTSSREEIAEAFMFTRDQHQLSNVKNDIGGNWFDPINTDEGDISNAVLLYNNFNNSVLTHELMHVVGLTDLYGSPSSPPLSLMSSGELAILPYEQFVLGWLPDSNVTCVNQSTEISQSTVSNMFTLDYSKGSHSLIIPTSINTAIIIDVLKSDSRVSLLYYALSNDKRPPIETFQDQSNRSNSVDLTNLGGISSQRISPEYVLLVTNNDGSRVTFSLIPTSKINTPDSMQMIENSKQRKNEVEAELIAKVLAERQAKSDAAARAAAELKAKQEAEEAIVAAELKAKQDAVAKAAAAKKITITCVKGTLTKKVTAIKPKCPSGFKAKK